MLSRAREGMRLRMSLYRLAPICLPQVYPVPLCRNFLKMVMGESRGGYHPLAEGLGDVPQEQKTQRVGEQSVLLFEIVT